MSVISITSNGTPARTAVRLDGVLLPGVTRIELKPIEAGDGWVQAVITIDDVILDLDLPAHQVALQKLEQAPADEVPKPLSPTGPGGP